MHVKHKIKKLKQKKQNQKRKIMSLYLLYPNLQVGPELSGKDSERGN